MSAAPGNLPKTSVLALVPGLNNTHAVFDRLRATLPNWIDAHALDCPALPAVEQIAQVLLDVLPERFWLCGFSFGGYVALAMLQAAPERVRGIALVCTGPFADTPEQAQKRRASLSAVDEGRYFETIAAQAANAFHPDSLADAQLMEERSRMVQAYGPERYRAHVLATIARPDRRHLLDGSRPTLVVAASHDKVFAPTVVAKWAETIPGGRFETIAKAGHLMPMEQPGALAQVLARWIG
ncbi:MAG: alpha/beta fold hydrolase [Variovorax sp.]